MKSLLNRILNGEHLSEQEAERSLGLLADPQVDRAVAGAFLAALRVNGETAEELRGFARAMRKMAMLPDGAELIDSGDLWFPVIIVENVHIFPGIPQLLQKKFESIRERFSGVPFSISSVYVTRHESDIAQSLHDLLGEFPDLMLGSYPRIAEPDYRVLLTLESRDPDYLKRALESLLRRLPPDAIHRVE